MLQDSNDVQTNVMKSRWRLHCSRWTGMHWSLRRTWKWCMAHVHWLFAGWSERKKRRLLVGWLERQNDGWDETKLPIGWAGRKNDGNVIDTCSDWLTWTTSPSHWLNRKAHPKFHIKILTFKSLKFIIPTVQKPELRLVAPVQGGLCHKALAALYVPIQVGPVYLSQPTV